MDAYETEELNKLLKEAVRAQTALAKKDLKELERCIDTLISGLAFRLGRNRLQ